MVSGLGVRHSRTADSADWRAILSFSPGSFELRAGFATASTSASQPLSVESIVSKFRDRKKNTSFMLGRRLLCRCAEQISHQESFDGDVENVLDYAFINLGIGSSSIDHPLLMTETLCNPAYSRALMNELLFENYQVPSVCYGLDSLFSAYQNGIHDGGGEQWQEQYNLGAMLDGKGLIDFSKSSSILLFPLGLRFHRLRGLQENLLCVQGGAGQESYEEFVGRMSDPDGLAKEDRILQFPYTADEEEKTQEEMEAALEKRRENGRRLQEQAQKTRLEKMLQKENDLKYFEQLKEWKGKERKAEYFKRLESEGFSSEGELDSTVRKLQATLKRSRAKELGDEEGDQQAAAEAPSFALVDVPDDQLDEEGIREKRKQRLLKAGHDARLRAKAEKEEERRLVELQLKKDDDERLNDPADGLQRSVESTTRQSSVSRRGSAKRRCSTTARA
ncbi:hypothetical protein L7F22_063413 [Adiantum nelumboides]|nr:hypothetical protein [Adiantum nelumboides]